jgi:hypothetical protein
MKRLAVLLPFVVLCLAGGPSGAQTPAPAASATVPESVTVTGRRIADDPNTVVDRFVKSYAAPSAFLGKLARWKDGICPKVSGLKPEVNAFIVQRLKQVAVQVRAPVNNHADCRINVEIVFTPQPQSFMNDIRNKVTFMLGYTEDSVSAADQLAQVTHPIQAWYDTQMEDYLGNKHPEKPASACADRHAGDTLDQLVRDCGIGYQASLFGDSIASTFTNVLIVADTNKVAGYSAAALADYTALLALSQTQAFDTCQALPSIINLLATGCTPDNQPKALTDTDVAYLQSLYLMEAGESLKYQRGDIARRMEKTLGTR